MANITVDIKKKSIEIGSNLVAIGKGGMSATVYDPDEIKADVFDMDNMKDGEEKHYVTTEQVESWDGKQDALTAGENVSIEDNVISAVDTTYTAGEGISIDENNVISNTQTSAEWGNIQGDIEDQTDLKQVLDSKQDTISDLAQIRDNATAGKTASDTIATYGDIVTHDADEFAAADDIGEGVLTIQKNSTTIDTFSANATNDKTINITVPTQASDIGAMPDTTKYAANLEMSINSSTYVITAQLKDQDGNNIGTQRTVDLPLESVVVDGEYDAENKKIILTLENGNTIEFSVADLVSGLQTEITAQNKLDADLVDDSTATNKFVTATDKTKLSNLSGVNTGDETQATIKTKLGVASSSQDGYLTKEDWSIFNSKQSAITNSDDITEGNNHLFMTTAERTKLGNQSGINTGDETQATIKTKLGSASPSQDGYLTKEDFATFSGKQDAIVDLEDIRDNATAGADAAEAIAGYGDVVTHDVSEFATAAQGNKADTALQPNDNISELVNDAGYVDGNYHDSTKQDVISDLATIRSGASAGATALQPNDNISELNNDANYITNADIGEGILTIQKNSTTIGSFGANATENKTINITVPVTASDVSALPNTTKYGANVSMSIDSSTYVVTLNLKDQDGNNLGTTQTIDLPLESVVVDGEYDAETKKIILTLENGNTIEFSVADLVSGLQTEITSTNKLDADLVDDSTSTNKFVSSSEKSTWNAKQDAISDLSTIRSGATAGATAVQPGDNISTLTDDVGYQTVDNMVTTLVGADNNHYPTAKTVADAISGGGFGDMLSSVYDPNSVESDAFDMDNMNDGINKHYISTIQQTVLNNTSGINTGDQSATDFDIKDLADSTGLRIAWSGKQDKLIAGSNIQIAADGKTISATDTTYTAGTGIDITNGVISNTQTSAEWGNIQGDIEDQTDLQNALSGKQNTISDLSTIRSNASAGAGAATTIAGYGDIVSHDADEFATAAQGAKADAALQSGDNISELINDVGYITSASLPEVGTGVLTIQKNSTTVDDFSANATDNKTINITVPTQASDVGALPDTTKYAANLDLSINSSTYVITAQLKDQDGNNIGTQRTVDLPLESVVVDGEYDAENKKIILTLENGNTIEFSVADLVSGLQTEITSTNKLDADLVDDSTSTNKFVTAADLTKLSNTSGVNTGDQSASDFDIKDLADTTSLRNTWSGKQDSISDLTTIRSNATAGAGAATTIAGYGDVVTHDIDEFATAAQGNKADSALQSGDNISELNNDVGYVTSSYHDSSKQDTINDLSTIRSGAGLGATAIQPNDNISELTNDVGYITSAPVTSVNNQTGNVVLTIPTTASDVGALPNTTKYGATLTLEINSSTYVVTATLKDQDGNTLGTAQTIDLPLESVVVSGSYDDTTKKIILTLQSGSTVEFSVADLVSGLQSEITSTNKLSSDLVDDTNHTNKFVTAAEKTKLSNLSGTNTGDETGTTIKTKLGAASASQDGYLTSTDWITFNNKQNAISDLATIRSGAEAGATALQPGDNISVLSNDAGYLTSSTGVTSVNGNTGAVTVSEFEPDNAGTTDQVLTKTADGYEWKNAAGSDYSWVTKTISGGEIEIGLRTIVNVPTGNFTLTAPATLKDGEEYAIRIISETSYTMTLGTGFTNPRNVDTTLSANATDQYVFLAIGGELELQPLVDTGA